MANVMASNPWVIDTPGPAVLVATWCKIAQFEFVEYTSTGDAVQVQDALGRLVWETTGDSDGQTQRSGRIGWINGFAVPSLSPGTKLIVYVD